MPNDRLTARNYVPTAGTLNRDLSDIQDLAENADKALEAADALKKALNITTIRELAESPILELAREVEASRDNPDHKYRHFGLPADQVDPSVSLETVAEIDLKDLKLIDDQHVDLLKDSLKVNTLKDLANVKVLQQAKQLLDKAVDQQEIAPNKKVEGRIFTESGVPAAGLEIGFFRKSADGKYQKNELRTITNAEGFYEKNLDPKGFPNFEIKMVLKEGQHEKFVSLSKTRFDIADHEIINLVAPVAPDGDTKTFEHEAVISALTEPLGDLKLEDVTETTDKRDITILAQDAKVDARLIALAADAERLSKATKIKNEHVYALLRAGVSPQIKEFTNLNPDEALNLLKEGKDKGINATVPQPEQFKKLYRGAAIEQRKKEPIPGAESIEAFVKTSGLDSAKQDVILETFLENEDPEFKVETSILNRLKAKGLNQDEIDRVRLHGQLGVLALGSTELAKELGSQIGSVEKITDLLGKGLYSAEKWVEELDAIPGSIAKLEKIIPKEFTGDPEIRKKAYAEELARQMRLNFPTDVLVSKLQSNKIELPPQDSPSKNHVTALFKRAKKLEPDFEIGQKPLDTFAAAHADKLKDAVASPAYDKALSISKKLQRLYQISPSDEALQVLLDMGIESAQDVLKYDPEQFDPKYIEFLKRRYPAYPKDYYWHPRLIRRKSEQVSAVTHSFFGAAKQLDSAPQAYVFSAPQEERDSTLDELNTKYPTMRSLFGALDYCDCEHCRSVTSPAAYFVDLLQFLDVNSNVWRDRMEDWKKEHRNVEYMPDWEANPDGSHRVVESRKPIDALLERRPDLEHLPLTCENTNTLLPYIDIVNEILEFYLVHSNTWHEWTGHDTGKAESAALLAEPHNVIAQAYDILKEQSVYPLSLPFDLWHETTKALFEHFDISWHEVLEAFRTEDTLRSNQPAKYGHDAVFAAQAGLSPAEVRVLTGTKATGGAGGGTYWFHLYGFDDDDSALNALKHPIELSQRLDVSYEELAALVGTSFVNPELASQRILKLLDIEPEDVFRYFEDSWEGPQREEKKAAFEQRVSEIEDKFQTEVFSELEKRWQEQEFDKVAIIRYEDDRCDFERAVLIYPDGKPVDSFLLHRLNVFVRLRRQLGWSIEGTDHVLTQIVSSGSKGTPQAFAADTIGDWIDTAIIYIAHLKEIQRLLSLDDDSLQKLCILWSPIPVSGPGNLYDSLFLIPGIENTRQVISPAGHMQDVPVFDDPFGRFLPDDGTLLKPYLSTVQASTGLSAEDLELVLAHAGLTLENAPLTLRVVSLLKRYAVLAKGLSIPVKELISLKTLSGLDPFKPFHPEPLKDIGDDGPFNQTIPFIELALAIKQSPVDWDGVAAITLHDQTEQVAFSSQETERVSNELRQIFEKFEGESASDDESRTPGADDFRPFVQQEAARLFDLEAELIDLLLDRSDLTGTKVDLGLPLHGVFDVRPLTAEYFDSTDLSGDPIGTAKASFAAVSANPQRPNTKSARISGVFEVPVAGQYTFVSTDQKNKNNEVKANLVIGGLADPVFDGVANSDGESVDLNSGVRYTFELEYTNLDGQLHELTIEGDQVPRQNIGKLSVQPSAQRQTLRRAGGALKRIKLIQEGLNLSGREVVYALDFKAAKNSRSLGELLEVDTTNAGGAERLEVSRDVFNALADLLHYNNIRSDISAGENLVEALSIARKETKLDTRGAVHEAVAKPTHHAFAKTFNRSADAVGEAVEALGYSPQITPDLAADYPAFYGLGQLQRIWTALKFANSLGVKPSILKNWAAPEPNESVVRDIKESLRRQFGETQWNQIAQATFDPIRAKKRDALTAKLLHRPEFQSVEDLYEKFLIDPAMEPVVQTSRLVQATASVQLFVHRSLLNLEPERVHASMINAKHWQWMKRYRVWEANRKIWLFPENWLEPEFRDDKSHLFQQLEGTLLEEDINQEAAEDAFHTYLSELEAMARLDIVSTYAEEDPQDPASNRIHVLARTYSEPRTYFYRQYSHQMWTPWEPVEAEIEGNTIVLTMWRGRLHIFWFSFFEMPEEAESTETVKIEELGAKSSQELSRRKGYRPRLNWCTRSKEGWTDAEAFDPQTVLVAPDSSYGIFSDVNVIDPQAIGVNHVQEFDVSECFVFANSVTYDNWDEELHLNLKPFDISFVFRGRNANLLGEDLYFDPIEWPFQTFDDKGNRRWVNAVQVARQSSPAIGAHFDLPAGLRSTANYSTLFATVPIGYEQNWYLTGFSVDTSFYKNQEKENDDGTLRDNDPNDPKIFNQAFEQVLRNGDFQLSSCENFSVHMTNAEDERDENSARLSKHDALLRPFFLQDDFHTFYVEPSLKVVTTKHFDAILDWVGPIPIIDVPQPIPRRPRVPGGIDPRLLRAITSRDIKDLIGEQIGRDGPRGDGPWGPRGPKGPRGIGVRGRGSLDMSDARSFSRLDSDALYNVKESSDWIHDTATPVVFRNAIIGPSGKL